MHTQAKNAARATGTRTLALWRAVLYHPTPVDFVPRPDEFGDGGGRGEGGGGGDGGGGEGGGGENARPRPCSPARKIT
jgi:hypothetical protein